MSPACKSTWVSVHPGAAETFTSYRVTAGGVVGAVLATSCAHSKQALAQKKHRITQRFIPIVPTSSAASSLATTLLPDQVCTLVILRLYCASDELLRFAMSPLSIAARSA